MALPLTYAVYKELKTPGSAHAGGAAAFNTIQLIAGMADRDTCRRRKQTRRAVLLKKRIAGSGKKRTMRKTPRPWRKC